MYSTKSDIFVLMGATEDADIGANLQRLRSDMSQTALAEAMKQRGHRWSQPTVVAVEKGERALRFSEALDLTEILRTPLDSFGRSAVDVDIIAARRRFHDARRALEAAVTEYENARLEIKYAVLEGIADGWKIPRTNGRDGWVEETPEAVIAMMRANTDNLLSEDSLREYVDKVAAFDKEHSTEQVLSEMIRTRSDGEHQATS